MWGDERSDEDSSCDEWSDEGSSEDDRGDEDADVEVRDGIVTVSSIESLIAILLANDPAHAKSRFVLKQEEPELMQAVRLALALAANRSVRFLEVCWISCPSSTSTLLVMFEALKQNTALLSFDMGLVGVERLKDEVGLAAAELIKQSQTLQSFALRCDFTEMGDAAGVAVAEAAGESPALRSLTLAAGRRMSDATGLALAEALGRSATLRSFSVVAVGSEMSEAAGLALAKALGRSASLESFSLWAARGMGNATGQALAEALGRSTTLRSFSVAAAVSEMGEATGQALAEALGRSASLESFSLAAARDMGEATGLALAKALGRSTSLESFSLRAADRMGNATGQALAEALGRSSALRSLSVEAIDSGMGDPAGLALAEALGRSSTLRSFELQAARQMGDATVQALAAAVASHTALQSFACDARFTGMSDGGGVAIAKALEQNSTLQSVSFNAYNTRVGDNTGLALAESIRTNATLRSIKFRLHGMDGQIRQAVRDAVEQSVIRNTDLHAQRQALRQLAGWDESTRFDSLRERVFRNKVFEFLYPPECQFVPLDFVDGKRIAKREEAEAEPEVEAEVEVEVDLRRSSPNEGSVAQPAGEPDNDEGIAEAKDEELEHLEVGQAMVASMHEANKQENSAIAVAILLSKADAPVAPNFDDDVTLLRITMFAKTAKVSNAIENSPLLAPCRDLVAEAGFELHPKWAGGAWLLLPFTEQQCIEVGLQLGPEHILVCSQDVPAVREAMKATAAKDKRPKVKSEASWSASQHAEGGSSASSGPSQIDLADMAGMGVELVVERTLFNFPLPTMDTRANVSAPP